MNCSYCEKLAEYSCGWIDEKGESHENYSCDEHKYIALQKQKNAQHDYEIDFLIKSKTN